MRILPLLPALAACAAAACPAVAAERAFSVTDVDRVEVDGPVEVTLATGGASHARAIGEAAALGRVAIDVQGRTLRVRPNRSAWGGYPGDAPAPVKVVLSTRNLRSASLIGAGRLAVDRARGLRLDLAVSGSGELALGSADADTMVIGLLGSGRIAVGGKAKQLRASIQGSGDLDGRGLNSEDAQLTANTSGAVAVGAARTAKVNALGRGTVEIIGAPACTVTGPSAGLVRCGR